MGLDDEDAPSAKRTKIIHGDQQMIRYQTNIFNPPNTGEGSSTSSTSNSQTISIPGISVGNPISSGSDLYSGTWGEGDFGENVTVKILPDDKRRVEEAKKRRNVPDHRYILGHVLTGKCTFNGLPRIYIAMKASSPLNLDKFVTTQRDSGVPFESNRYKLYAQQVTSGTDFLHRNDIIIGSLSPSNLVLSTDKSMLKICNFGFTNSDNTQDANGWKPPELLANQPTQTPASDIYTLGMIDFYLLSYGKHPHGDDPHSWPHFIKNGESCRLDGLCVENKSDAKSMIRRMLKKRPQERPSAGDVLRHPFFNPDAPENRRMPSSSGLGDAAQNEGWHIWS